MLCFQQNGVKVLPCKVQQKVEREKHLIDFSKNVSICLNLLWLSFIIFDT